MAADLAIAELTERGAGSRRISPATWRGCTGASSRH
jgi:hypothetical protein